MNYFDSFMASPQIEEDSNYYFYGDYPVDSEDEYPLEDFRNKNLTF